MATSNPTLRAAQGPRNAPELAPNITYEIFILLVTLLSLSGVLARLLVPLDQEIKLVLTRIDGVYAIVLLVDYVARVVKARPHRLRYITGMGIFDLLGSLPAVSLLRLLRIPRLVQQVKLLRNGSPRGILYTARQQLASSTLWTVAFVVLLVVVVGSSAIVRVEENAPNANIITGDDAIWWAIVTLATVGYGDRFPVTFGGRLIGTVFILMGVGFFSVLTSYLASTFLKPDPEKARSQNAALHAELAAIRQTLARLDARLDALGGAPAAPDEPDSDDD